MQTITYDDVGDHEGAKLDTVKEDAGKVVSDHEIFVDNAAFEDNCQGLE